MQKNQTSTAKRSKNNLDSSFIDTLRELGFCTGKEALEQQRLERIAEFIRFKEKQDNVIDDIRNID